MSSAVRRIAVVTGAGSGIGRAVSIALAGAGWRVALAGRRLDRLEETARMTTDPESALAIPCDVTRENEVIALFARVRDRLGRVDLLFNNAGIFQRGVPIEDTALADWQAVVNVNLTGAFLCLREAFRTMKAQNPRGGRIINNGSLAAQVPRPDSVGYTTTKHAMTGLTRQASLDGRRYDIAVGQIDVGNAATEMTTVVDTGVPQADGRIAVEPRMAVEDVARAVLTMADMQPGSNVQFLTVLATKMPFVGRG